MNLILQNVRNKGTNRKTVSYVYLLYEYQENGIEIAKSKTESVTKGI